MCPQAEGRLRGEVDEVRGYHKGARRLVKSFCLLSSRWQAFIRRALYHTFKVVSVLLIELTAAVLCRSGVPIWWADQVGGNAWLHVNLGSTEWGGPGVTSERSPPA